MKQNVARALQQLDAVTSTPLNKKELAEAVIAARAKLKRIIDMEGDADGIRLESWYFYEIISEELRSRRISGVTMAFTRLIAEMEAMGQKEAAGDGNTKPHKELEPVPIVA